MNFILISLHSSHSFHSSFLSPSRVLVCGWWLARHGAFQWRSGMIFDLWSLIFELSLDLRANTQPDLVQLPHAAHSIRVGFRPELWSLISSLALAVWSLIFNLIVLFDLYPLKLPDYIWSVSPCPDCLIFDLSCGYRNSRYRKLNYFQRAPNPMDYWLSNTSFNNLTVTWLSAIAVSLIDFTFYR